MCWNHGAQMWNIIDFLILVEIVHKKSIFSYLLITKVHNKPLSLLYELKEREREKDKEKYLSIVMKNKRIRIILRILNEG